MEIENYERLIAKLEKIAAIKVTNGITKGCLRVVRTAKEIVPVDTGMLRNSITYEVEGNVGSVGSALEYAPNVELGIKQKPQPYLQPSLEINRDAILKDIQEDYASQIKEVTL